MLLIQTTETKPFFPDKMKLIPQGHRYELRAHIQTMGGRFYTNIHSIASSLYHQSDHDRCLDKILPAAVADFVDFRGLEAVAVHRTD